ncbi:hypothetical protein ES703_64079 [subsurface metagenome]
MLSDETKRKISESCKGRIPWNKNKPHSVETRAKISALAKARLENRECHPFYGRHHSEETKQKISQQKKHFYSTHPNPFAGHQHTLETKEKIRLKALGRLGYNEGRRLPEQTRRKLSLALSGKHRSEESRLKQSNTYKRMWRNPDYRHRMENLIFKSIRGKGHSQETRQKISKKLKERLTDSMKNPNWRGGLSFEPYPSEFNNALKESIRERDNYICQKCGVPECECLTKLHIHHIDYDKSNCLPSNLVSLCHKCNSQVNTNRESWQKFFESRDRAKIAI